MRFYNSLLALHAVGYNSVRLPEFEGVGLCYWLHLFLNRFTEAVAMATNVNVLLVGMTGSGKSTFINLLFNYFNGGGKAPVVSLSVCVRVSSC